MLNKNNRKTNNGISPFTSKYLRSFFFSSIFFANSWIFEILNPSNFLLRLWHQKKYYELTVTGKMFLFVFLQIVNCSSKLLKIKNLNFEMIDTKYFYIFKLKMFRFSCYKLKWGAVKKHRKSMHFKIDVLLNVCEYGHMWKQSDP